MLFIFSELIQPLISWITINTTFLAAMTQAELVDSIVNILPESLQGEYTVPAVGLLIVF